MHKAWVQSLLLILVGSVACGEAQTLDEAVRDSRVEIEQFLVESSTPGLSIAVQLRDHVVWAEGFGLANVEFGVPVTTETLFRVGSISKALTSAAVGLLHERGELDLDAPVQTYVPSFPEKKYPITTRQLGGHLSGLPHYGPEDFQNFVPYSSVVAALDKFKNRQLLFRPGDQYLYSSFGFNLISAVIEGAAGESFLLFMHDEIFDPLGMEHTVADDYRAVIPNRTSFYELNASGQLGNAPFTDNSDVWAAGGFLSTPTELVTFAHGLTTGDLLSPETLQVLFKSMTTSAGEQTGYGLGWRVRENADGQVTISHVGGHFGASAELVVSTSQGLIIAVTANMSGANVAVVLNEVGKRFSTVVERR
ncbi:MAG: beta-lactamase family protein [Candidatus Latescibacteria bacterium]|jgi:serine beta-lactamase-like protein LACTB, mitochondrial|nr:beta-lactamase family protein [Candidatus Latescibacterota bacterium]